MSIFKIKNVKVCEFFQLIFNYFYIKYIIL